jgi:hypothetical protein
MIKIPFIFGLFLLVSLAFAQTVVATAQCINGAPSCALSGGSSGGMATSTSLNCEQFAGSTFDVKVNACLTAAAGGTADASGIAGAQTVAATIVYPANTVLKVSASLVASCDAGANPCISYKSGDTLWSDTYSGPIFVSATATNELIAPATPATQTSKVLVHGVSFINANDYTTAALLDLTNTSYATIEYSSFTHEGGPGDAIFSTAIAPYNDIYNHFINNDIDVPGGEGYDLETDAYIFTIIGGQVRSAKDCVYLAPATNTSGYGIDGGDIIGLKCINDTGYAFNTNPSGTAGVVNHVHWIGGRMESNVSAGLVNICASHCLDFDFNGITLADNQTYGVDQGQLTWVDYNNANAYTHGFIAGNLTVEKALTVTGAVTLNGLANSATGEYVCYNGGVLKFDTTTCTLSLLKYKQDIAPLTGALNEVALLRPVEYRYKPEMNLGDLLHIGLIADEVAKVDPRIAAYKSNGELESVDYEHITALLVSAVQEQQQEIEELKKACQEFAK